MKTITAFFSSRDQAEHAVRELRNKGFDKEISVLAKGQEEGNNSGRTSNYTGGDSITNGTSSGAAIGGLAGLALGAGALAIPGFGPLIAAGPIAATLSGAATGGLPGDWLIMASLLKRVGNMRTALNRARLWYR